ncbi:MAG TPA: class I SAM-dependent methyltransferase, partial [Chloroflexi bacterium]|nr:class I SAM-dependent methyltransferase [Chloroflexota bacterium]
FDGKIVGLDRSVGMLRQARIALADHSDRVTLLRGDAGHLAFADESFDAVTSLESLEFMPDPAAVIAEMLRVLKPGGVMLVSNRVGRDARYFPGRLCGRGRLENHLQELGMEQVRTDFWQVHYDLIWGRKAPA